MHKTIAAALLAAGLIATPAFAADAPKAAPAAKPVPAVILGGAVKAEAEVIAVDQKARKVTLKGDEGTIQDIVVGKEAKNLPQVKVGDRVVVAYDQILALRLKNSPGLRETDEREGSATAAAGQKPGAVAVKETHFFADIINVDAKKGVVTIRGAKGRIVDLKIKDKAVLAQAKVGDQVEGFYEQVLSLVVLPPAAKK
jgi:Cu/Ag efflux protein CusF